MQTVVHQNLRNNGSAMDIAIQNRLMIIKYKHIVHIKIAKTRGVWQLQFIQFLQCVLCAVLIIFLSQSLLNLALL